MARPGRLLVSAVMTAWALAPPRPLTDRAENRRESCAERQSHAAAVALMNAPANRPQHTERAATDRCRRKTRVGFNSTPRSPRDGHACGVVGGRGVLMWSGRGERVSFCRWRRGCHGQRSESASGVVRAGAPRAPRHTDDSARRASLRCPWHPFAITAFSRHRSYTTAPCPPPPRNRAAATATTPP